MMYSLLNTAKLNNSDPEEYLAQVLSTISEHPVNLINELWSGNIEITTTSQYVIIGRLQSILS